MSNAANPNIKPILKMEIACEADMANGGHFRFTFATPYAADTNPDLIVVALVVKRYFETMYRQACDKWDMEREFLSYLAWAKTSHEAQELRQRCPSVIKYLESIAASIAEKAEASK